VFITPRGATMLKEGDTIMLAGDNKEQLREMDARAIDCEGNSKDK